MTEGGESEDSQVSVRIRMSRELHRIKSRRTTGLSRSSVTEEAERILRVAKERLLELEEEGPGLSSTSPDKSRQK